MNILGNMKNFLQKFAGVDNPETQNEDQPVDKALKKQDAAYRVEISSPNSQSPSIDDIAGPFPPSR